MTDHGLVAFLRARLGEDEEIARTAPGPSWERRQIRGDFDKSVVLEDYIAVADPDCNTVVLADVAGEVLPFVLRHDPTRVLSEVDAKRRIVDQYVYWQDMADQSGIASLSNFMQGERHGLWQALRLLALSYRNHPDYRPEWAPDA